MQEDLGREYYLTGSGHKPEPAFQEIYDKYHVFLGEEALRVVRASGSNVILEWLAELRAGRKTAFLDEKQIVWEQEKVLHVGECEIEYLKAPIELANSADREFRIALDDVRSRASASGLDDLRRDRFQLEHEEMGQLGLGNYVESLGVLAGIDFAELCDGARKFLEATEAM